MQAKFVSIIVPNYNHAPYLKQRLDSIFNQTFQDFEVIILDDCSTDNSKEIIEQYRNNPKVSHIVYNETNSGSPFKQWEKGINLAQGEYIWIAESDDWADSCFLKEIIPFFTQYSRISFVYSDPLWEFPQKTEFFPIFDNSQEVDGNNFIQENLCWGNSIYNASSVVFKRLPALTHIKKITNYKGCGDYLFWLSLCENSFFFYYTKKLNHFRQHKKNTTKINESSGNALIERYWIFQQIKAKKFLSRYKKYSISLNLLNAAKSKHNTQAISLWKKEILVPIFAKAYILAGNLIWSIIQKIKSAS